MVALLLFPAWSLLQATNSPRPPCPQPLPSSRTLATQPSLATRILGDKTPTKHWPENCGQNVSNLPAILLPAMKDLFTSRGQACWEERIRKEVIARTTWKVKHGHKYPKERSLPGKQLQQALFHSPLGVGSLPATSSPDRRTGLPETKEVRAQLSRGVGVQEVQRATRGPTGQTKPGSLEMRPVPSSTLQLLFQGISHDGQGRALYLRERNRQKPEEKFQYPIVSSWEYGWHVGKGHHLLPFQAFAGSLPPSPASCFITPHSPAHTHTLLAHSL